MTTADPATLVRAALDRTGVGSSDYDLNPDAVLPFGRKLRAAAVLVPILYASQGARVYLTKRSSALQHHPGQIAFPGGKRDAHDADIVATALREASEEIGLNPLNVEILGVLPPHETVTGFEVTPVVGRVRSEFCAAGELGEVDEVFEVPLEQLLDLERYSVQARRWQGNLRKYYTVPYGPYYIWGATARILRALADAAETP